MPLDTHSLQQQTAYGLYAHTSDSNDRDTWEPLLDHLEAVAVAARHRAESFGAGQLGYHSGLLHDIGKADPDVQAYLSGTGPRHPHSAQGAQLASHVLPTLPGKILAFGIAGHHTGLPNAQQGTQGGTPLAARLLTQSPPLQPAWLQLPGLAPTDIPPALKGRKGSEALYAVQFLTRMLFSCLVDADRTETARFYGAYTEPSHPPLKDLQARLNAHLDRMGSRATGAVNETRKAVLSSCRAGATQAPGLFSLSVPTGGGKTLSSLAFALDHAIKNDLRQIIYVVPYTSIIEQTADVFRSILGPEAVLEHHSNFDASSARALPSHREATQTWDAPIIVTTAVQFFESLYANRPTQCRKLHRISKSVVILDEAQALPLDLLRPCLAAIRELAVGYGSSLVLCTATQPAILSEDGFRVPEALTRDLADRIPIRELASSPTALHSVLRRVEVHDAGMLSDAALHARLTEHQQALVIVNSRAHARALAARCRHLEGAFHLTTSMTPRHRRAVLDDVRSRLSAGKPVRLIATSLVEAGVDLDFPVVFRAIAGLDSIAQAAGRCNREGRMSTLGQVFIFRPEEGYGAPKSLKPLIAATERVLKTHEDPISPSAIRDWFSQVYWTRGDDLDCVKVGGTKGILASIAAAGTAFDFQFADIAHAFRFIDDDSIPLVIQGAFGVAPDVLISLQGETCGRKIAEVFQQVQVQVPRRVMDAFIAKGAARPWRENEFGDQFMMLADPSLYDPALGLDKQG